MNVAAILERWAGETPDQAAIIQHTGRPRDTITFAQLRDASAALGAALTSRGVRSGDPVSLLTPVSIRLYVALIGALRIGAVPVVVDPGLGVGGLRRCLRRARPRAVLGTTRTLALTTLLPELWPARRIAVRTHAATLPAPSGIADLDPQAPALITFTSGSTGLPKAIVRSHALLLAQNRALGGVLDQCPGDVSLATLPIFVLANLAAGVTSVLADADLRRPGFIDPDPVLDQIDRFRPISTVASPAFLARLGERVRAGRALEHRFERVFTGGAPVFPDMVDAIAPLTGQGRVVIVYGSSEAEPITHLDHLDAGLRDAVIRGAGLPVGRPVGHVRLRIIRDASGTPLGPLSSEELDRMTLAPDMPGEIIVAGEHVVCGYLDSAGDSDTKIRVGPDVWHRTGDAGRLDVGGSLWLLGRAGAKALTDSGEPVYPFPVEAAIREAIGARCALRASATRPAVVIEAARGTLDRDSLARARQIAARHGVERVATLARIPLDARHNAKVDYTRLASLRPAVPAPEPTSD